MNAEITRTQRQIIELYEKQHAYLAGKPVQMVTDLMHEAEHVGRSSPTFSERMAGQINAAAAHMALEDIGQWNIMLLENGRKP